MTHNKTTDIERLNALCQTHGLRFVRVRRDYYFVSFKAHGLRQALGFVEGFDIARRAAENPELAWITGPPGWPLTRDDPNEIPFSPAGSP
jgi:hypothetical protein